MLIDLQKLTTRDGVALDGGVVWPKRKSATAAIFIHGLTGTFSSWFPRMEPLVRALTRQGIAVASFGTRGSGVVSKLTKVAPTPPPRRGRQGRGAKQKFRSGGAFEKFEDCVHDIRAVIDFLARHGYHRIVLVGHSTGANKAVYYTTKTRDRRVRQLVLLGPLSDVVGEMQERGRSFKTLLARAQKQVREGKGDELFMPVYPERLWSAKRYLSLYTPGSREDVFPYYSKKGNWRAVESIRIPTLVVIGDSDQYLDRDVRDVMDAFQKHVRDFRGVIIRDADHSFNKREKELAQVVSRFVHGR